MRRPDRLPQHGRGHCAGRADPLVRRWRHAGPPESPGRLPLRSRNAAPAVPWRNALLAPLDALRHVAGREPRPRDRTRTAASWLSVRCWPAAAGRPRSADVASGRRTVVRRNRGADAQSPAAVKMRISRARRKLSMLLQSPPMPMENDEHEQRDVDKWVSTALAPARGDQRSDRHQRVRAQDALLRARGLQLVKCVALGATGLRSPCWSRLRMAAQARVARARDHRRPVAGAREQRQLRDGRSSAKGGQVRRLIVLLMAGLALSSPRGPPTIFLTRG